MKISKNEIKWGDYSLKPEFKNKGLEPFYFTWFPISKVDRDNLRYFDKKCFGFNILWYDQPHSQLNLWFFGFGWSTEWSTWHEE
jgi:hypothetical protein